jgi:hypothetical protein
MRRAAGIVAVCAAGWLVAFGVWRSSPASFDFVALYASARLVAVGRAADVTDRAAIAAMEHEVRPERSLFLNNPNPPVLSLLLAPLGALPFEAAYAIWLTVLVAAAAGAALLLGGTMTGGQRAALFALALLAPPTLVAFVNGQTTPLLLLALAAALRAPPRWSGLLLAATALRPQFAPLFGLVALMDPRRRWPFVAGAAAVALSSLLLVGIGGVPGYLDLVTYSAAEMRPVDVGLASLVRRLAGLDDALSSLALSAGLLALAAIAIVRTPAERRVAEAGAWSLVAAPHALPHDDLVVYPAVAARATTTRAAALWAGSGVAVALVHQAGLPIASLWLLALAAWPHAAAFARRLRLR